jgi:DNA-binding GntR family transcriptional regulator
MAIKRLDAGSNFGSNCLRMKRELKPEEHEEIVNAVAAGDRVKATSIYLSATEGNLTDAQNFVRTLTEEKIAAQQLEKKSS